MARRKDLLSEAIADAKAVRATAIANAKIALEEAFTPRLQSILSQKLQQEIEEADEEAEEIEENEVVEETETVEEATEEVSEETVTEEEDKEEEVEFDQQVENSSYVSQDFLRQRMDRSESNPFTGEIRRDAQPSMSSNPYK